MSHTQKECNWGDQKWLR